MRRAALVLAVAALVGGSAGGATAAAAPDAGAPAATADPRVEADITFRRIGGETLKLDAFVPAGGGLRPGVIVIYGGGWVLGNRKFAAPLAQQLADEGFVAFAPDYRLAPAHPFPAAVEDVQASVEWVRAHAAEFGVDPARIGAIGGSAGGHLAAMLATLGEGPHDRGSRIAAAVSWAGPMDLRLAQFEPLSHPFIRTFLDCLARPCDEATVVAASPISHVDPDDPPMLLANGEDDVLVPPDQAARMADALERAGVPRELLLVPDAGHDERVEPPVVQPSFEFLRRELGGAEPASLRDIGVGAGDGGAGGWLAPTIAVVVVVLVVGSVVVVGGMRRRQRVQH